MLSIQQITARIELLLDGYIASIRDISIESAANEFLENSIEFDLVRIVFFIAVYRISHI